jgi:hypothetical protein
LVPAGGFVGDETTPGHQRSHDELIGKARERLAAAAAAAKPRPNGTVADVVGLAVRVRGIRPGVGELVTVHTAAGPLPAQVVAVHRDDAGDGATCMPLGATTGIATGDEVVPSRTPLRVPAGPGLLGPPEGERAAAQHQPEHRRRQGQLHFPPLAFLADPHHRHRPLALGERFAAARRESAATRRLSRGLRPWLSAPARRR